MKVPDKCTIEYCDDDATSFYAVKTKTNMHLYTTCDRHSGLRDFKNAPATLEHLRSTHEIHIFDSREEMIIFSVLND